MWARRAKEEHDVFAEALRDRGVTVHYFGQLLAETLDLPAGREFVLDRVCTPEVLGPALVQPFRRLAEDLDGASLAEYLVGGVLKADLRPLRAHSLKWDMLQADDFVLPPLPNHLFPRDNSCWVYRGVSVNPMAKPARQRETLHIRAIYRYHPLFAGASSSAPSTTRPPRCDWTGSRAGMSARMALPGAGWSRHPSPPRSSSWT